MTTKSTRTKIILNVTRFILHILLNAIFYIIVVIVIANFSTTAYEFAYQIFGDVAVESEPGHDIEVKIKKGESTISIATKLEKKKVILNKYSFLIRAKITNKIIIPGTFVINSSMNYDEILNILTTPSKEESNKAKE